MRLLTIARSHDANFCMYDSDTGFFQYIKVERFDMRPTRQVRSGGARRAN